MVGGVVGRDPETVFLHHENVGSICPVGTIIGRGPAADRCQLAGNGNHQ